MANPTEPSSGKKKSRRWIFVVLAVALMASAGAGAAVYVLTGKASRHAEAPPPPPTFVSLEPFTVNLSGDGGERYLHIGLSLRVANARTQQSITEHMPEIRSRVLLLLSSKQASDLNTIDGKRKLAAQIRTLASQPFSAGQSGQQVDDVLFTAFVIQ